MSASSIQRWAAYLSSFDYNIKYIKGRVHSADALSRLPGSLEAMDESDEKNYLNYIEESGIEINCKEIRRETATATD